MECRAHMGKMNAPWRKGSTGGMDGTWWVYMIECRGGRIYTGIARDPEARFRRHAAGNGAAFTRMNPPVALLAKRPCGSRTDALREERSLRRLSPGEKRAWAAAAMDFWDERYAAEEFVYGTEPNEWLRAAAGVLPQAGRVLSLGEGEGRNAAWLAKQGYRVDAVDRSRVGLSKAARLARERGVEFARICADAAGYVPEPGAYDGVVLIYLHLPPDIRPSVHRAAVQALRPGGHLILEAFTPGQLRFSSGGPSQPEMLYDAETIRGDMPGMLWQRLSEEEVVLAEGRFHVGRAAVLRALGRKPGP